MVVVCWDGMEEAARHRMAELSAYYSRAMRRSYLASWSHLLVFGSGMLEMSYKWEAVAAML